MNYLTNYYKNLCEQLQAREKQLLQILSEAGEIVLPGVPGINPGVQGPMSPAPSPAGPANPPATAPTQTPGPDRPDPRGYPGGAQDPNYQKDWYDYFKWWQKQTPTWKAKNPLPVPPMRKGTGPRPRPGGGHYPGEPSRPYR